MSELIEKFSGRFAIYQNQTFVFELTIDEISAIISALETVRGIEEIVKTGWGLELVQQTDGPWLIWYGALRNDFADGPTLSAAIEAARKGM